MQIKYEKLFSHIKIYLKTNNTNVSTNKRPWCFMHSKKHFENVLAQVLQCQVLYSSIFFLNNHFKDFRNAGKYE